MIDGRTTDEITCDGARARDGHRTRYRAMDTSLGRWTRQDPIGYEDGLNTFEYGRSRPALSLDPYGLSVEQTRPSTSPSTTPGKLRPGGFLDDFTPIPIPEGETRVAIPLAEGLRMLGITDPDKHINGGQFKRGCQDLFNFLTGIAIVTCFETPAEANAFQCKPNQLRITGAIQGYPGAGGLVRKDDASISPLVFDHSRPFNYAIQQPDGTFIFLNHGDDGRPQEVYVRPNLPTGPIEGSPAWTTIYCVICSVSQ